MKGGLEIFNERPTKDILNNELINEQKLSNENPIPDYIRHKNIIDEKKKIREVSDKTEKNNK